MERHSNEATKHPGKTCLGIGHHVWEHHSAKGFVDMVNSSLLWGGGGLGGGGGGGRAKYQGLVNIVWIYIPTPPGLFFSFFSVIFICLKKTPLQLSEAKYVTSTKLTQEHFSAEPQNSHEFSSIAKLQELVFTTYPFSDEGAGKRGSECAQ